jgi:predicted RNA-binding protein Jag
VNDYESSKDERLFSFIQSKINEVKKTWVECKLPFYTPYERKKIHSYVADLKDDSFYTQSRGEDKQRRLYICKQAKKLTIDIDWDDI